MAYILLLSYSGWENDNTVDTHMEYVEHNVKGKYVASVMGNKVFCDSVKEYTKLNSWTLLTPPDNVKDEIDFYLSLKPNIIFCFFQKVKSLEEMNILKKIHQHDTTIKTPVERPFIRVFEQNTHKEICRLDLVLQAEREKLKNKEQRS